MKILSALIKKSRSTTYENYSSKFFVKKDGSGVHELVSKISGETLNPATSLGKFMKVMPQLTESKCPNYGSDD